MTEYAPRPALVATLAAAAALALLGAAVDRGPGRWLLLVAGAGLGAEAARGALLRPVLRIGEEGLDLVLGWRREHVPWDALDAVGAPRETRRMVTSSWLELDLGERVVSLPAYRLGAPPAAVADRIRSAGRPRRP